MLPWPGSLVTFPSGSSLSSSAVNTLLINLSGVSPPRVKTVFSPILFIIYINDLSRASSVSSIVKCLLFADDTSVCYSHNDINQLISVLNCEIEKIMNWLCGNKLSQDEDKSYLHGFSIKPKKT